MIMPVSVEVRICELQTQLIFFSSCIICTMNEGNSSAGIPFIMTKPVTIKFNVGGTRYEVSQSLVNSFPNTLLAKSASAQWNEDPNAEIFIERDGSCFQYVLCYMRDGHANLPVCVSKNAVLEDLKYYGFENVNVEGIADAAATTFVFGKSALLVEELLASWKKNADLYEDTIAVLEAYIEQRKLSLSVKERKGRSFLDCNELLKSAGLCVEKAQYSHGSNYCVTLKLL
jgi:hypothetical protein